MEARQKLRVPPECTVIMLVSGGKICLNTCTVESIDFVGAQCSWKFVSKTRQRVNILHKLINYSYKVIFPYVCVRENMKLRPHELVEFRQSMKIGPHKFE